MSAGPVGRETLVRDVLTTVAGAPRAFERHRVDYCCHGALPLESACERVGARVADVLAALAEESSRPGAEPPWTDPFAHAAFEELVRHLAAEVHAAARVDAVALQALVTPIASRSDAHRAIAAEIERLCHELETHMAFEERYVFPYVVALERTGEIPPALFHSVVDPFAKLLREHEAADDSLDQLRALTLGYTPPASADRETRALYAALAAFDKALVHHMHLEGNLLFPRVVQFESSARRPVARRSRR